MFGFFKYWVFVLLVVVSGFGTEYCRKRPFLCTIPPPSNLDPKTCTKTTFHHRPSPAFPIEPSQCSHHDANRLNPGPPLDADSQFRSAARPCRPLRHRQTTVRPSILQTNALGRREQA
ncbi:hypothetical protein CCHR01_03752 [Colletotrichum chrysophilum]|uniref:Secreted protein n=1 Tax=Colletotrichum chrysophilum TaxID=1836956 RepID=A0AAD9ER53_9PEZI|nr:hypothetical protein CCHR01_03752 [Colletotrichum chrysophilum]